MAKKETTTPTESTDKMPKLLDASKQYYQLIEELYRSFDFFNKRFMGDKPLPRPIITVASKGNARAYGWFGSKFWVDRDGNVYNEINLSAEYLNRSVNDLLETIIHEMAHLKNSVAGIKDCNHQQRHNKHFKEAAEFFGLVVEKMGNKGFAKTSLGQEAKNAIAELKPKEDLYKVFRAPEKIMKPPSKLAPIMILREGKEIISSYAEGSGMSAREITEQALLAWFKKNDQEVYEELQELEGFAQ